MHCISAVNTHGTPVSSMHCTGTGLTRATLPSGWSARRLPTSAARLGASVRRPRLGVAHPAHICTGTERLAACCMVAAGSASDGRAWHDGASSAARTLSAGVRSPPDARTCDGTGLAPAHCCRATGLTPPVSAIGPSSPPPTAASALQQQRKQDWLHPVPHWYGDMARPWSMFKR